MSLVEVLRLGSDTIEDLETKKRKIYSILERKTAEIETSLDALEIYLFGLVRRIERWIS